MVIQTPPRSEGGVQTPAGVSPSRRRTNSTGGGAVALRPARRDSSSPSRRRSRSRELSVPRFEAPYGPQAIERSHYQLSRTGVVPKDDQIISRSPASTPRSRQGFNAVPDAVIPVSAYRKLIPKKITAGRELGVTTIGVVRPSPVFRVPPQHVERMPFGTPRYDPVPQKKQRSLSARRDRERGRDGGHRRGAPKGSLPVRWCRAVWDWLRDSGASDGEITAREERLAAWVDEIPLLPTPLKRSVFDALNFGHNFFTSRGIYVVVFLVVLLGVLANRHMLPLGSAPILQRVSGFTSNLFAGIKTEEGNRPGLRFFDTYNAGSTELPGRHPVVILPGFITTGLEIWEAQASCLKQLGVNPSLRSWMLGPTMIMLMLRDPACWLHLFSLDPVTGLDRDGTRIRGGEGAAAVGEFVPGFWVWEKIMRNLADIGYDQSNLAIATYDWRLSPDLMQERDGFFHRMRHVILRLYEQHRRPVAIIGHSYASAVLVDFLQWAEKQEKGFCNTYVAHIINIGGLTLGAPKTLSGTLFGDAHDTLAIPALLRSVLDRVVDPSLRYNFLRTWSCLFSMLPHPCLDYEGGILQNDNVGEQCDDRHMSTTEALELLQEDCQRTGHLNCVTRVKKRLNVQTLPSLPKAPKTKMFCLYGINKPTETGYHVVVSDKEEGGNVAPNSTGTPRGGVKLGNGDGTVPLASLAYMCRAPNGWKQNLGEVVTLEFQHNTTNAALLDFRGGTSSSDHVDILGNHDALEAVLRIVSGVEERRPPPPGIPPLQDVIFSNVDEVVLHSDATAKCRALKNKN